MAKITKSKLNELMSLSNNLDIDLVVDNKNSFEAHVKGSKNKMKKNDFQDLVISELKNINGRLGKIEDRLEKVETRLDIVDERLDKIENRIIKIENTPTLKKELK